LGRPPRSGLPEPLQLAGDPYALSRALDEIRGERFVSYDERQSAAARLARLRTVAPGR
jgi:hypothetical protein